MIVVGSHANNVFCGKLAKELQKLNYRDESIDFFPYEMKVFHDSERKIRLTDGFDDNTGFKDPDQLIYRIRRGEMVVSVFRGKSGENWNPDGLFVEALLTLGALRSYGADQRRLCAVFPYYIYSRQHDITVEGECHSAKIVRKAIKDGLAGIMITVSAHNYRHEGEMDNRVWNMDATESVIGFAPNLRLLPERYIVTPDSGQYSGKLRFPLANSLNAGTIAFGKERDVQSGEIDVEVRNLEGLKNPGEVSLLLYDDERSTGETMFDDIELCLEHGIKKENIHAIAIHDKNVVGEKYNKYADALIAETGVNFYSSDSIESPRTAFSVTPQLASYIKKRFW